MSVKKSVLPLPTAESWAGCVADASLEAASATASAPTASPQLRRAQTDVTTARSRAVARGSPPRVIGHSFRPSPVPYALRGLHLCARRVKRWGALGSAVGLGSRDEAVGCGPAMSVAVGMLESVNVGAARTVEAEGRSVLTAIWKSPVDGRVALGGVNLAGDDQADRTVHGGPDKAVYAYAAEDTEWWAAQLGEALGPAVFGENLTVRG